MTRCHMSTLKNLTSSDLDASGSFVNINEDDSIPIRILKVSPTEIKLANGDVVPPTCIFLQGQTFVWSPPPVDPMTAMPSGKGWEAWTEDVWSIFDMTMPKPGTLLSHSHRNTCLRSGNTVLPVPHKIRSLLHSMGIQLDVQNTVRTPSLPSASCVLNIQFAYRGRPQCRSSALAPHVDVIWYLLHRMNGLHRKVLNQIV